MRAAPSVERTACPTLLLRADGGGTTGTGHLMRLLALGQAWQDRGGRAVLVTATCPDSMSARFAVENITVQHLSSGDAAEILTVAAREAADWIALDGYAYDEALQADLRAAGVIVLALDDYGHCATWAADLVLNQNFDAAGRAYAMTTPGATVLRGPRFVLLRREFRTTVCHTVPAPNRRHLLVTLGGADADNTTGTVLQNLPDDLGHPWHIRVLVGGANPHRAILERLAATSPHRIELITDCTDMPAMYAWADRIVSASGSTCYEWLRCGVPAAVAVIADNQRPIAAWLRQQRAATVLSDDATYWRDELSAWLRDTSIPPPPTELVDAGGALRVVDALRAKQPRRMPLEVAHV